MCVSPFVGAGDLTGEMVQTFSFGEGADDVAALRGGGWSALPSVTAEEGQRMAANVVGGDGGDGGGHGGGHGGDHGEGHGGGDGGDGAEEEEAAAGAGGRWPRYDWASSSIDGVGSGMAAGVPAADPLASTLARTHIDPPAGFFRIEIASVTASSEDPNGGRPASHLVDGSGMRLEDDAQSSDVGLGAATVATTPAAAGLKRLVSSLCLGSQGLACGGQCWRSDPSANGDAQWVQLDFAGGTPRHVDMIQLYAFNSAHGTERNDSLLAADVQVPDANAKGGWRTVGRLEPLPIAPAVDGDPGINVRAAGLPTYLVPPRYRARGVRMLTASWLGFETTSIRFAMMATHRATYVRSGIGLCHLELIEEDPSASLQLLGSAAVRGRMLQLTPGAAFAAAAARADMQLPPTLGTSDLDASARDMRERLRVVARLAAGAAGGGAAVRSLRELEEEGVVHISGRGDGGGGGGRGGGGGGDGGGGAGGGDRDGRGDRDEPSTCHGGAANDDSRVHSPASSTTSNVLIQTAMDALGDATVEVSQTWGERHDDRYGSGEPAGGGRARQPVWYGGHGRIPRGEPDEDYRVRGQRLPGPSATEDRGVGYGMSLGSDGEGSDGSGGGGGGGGVGGGTGTGGGGGGGGPRSERGRAWSEDCSSADSRLPTLRLTSAGWLPDASDVLPASLAVGERTSCRWSTADGLNGGVSRLRSTVAETEAKARRSATLLLGAAFVPVTTKGGAPLTYFKAEADLFVGTAMAVNVDATRDAAAAQGGAYGSAAALSSSSPPTTARSPDGRHTGHRDPSRGASFRPLVKDGGGGLWLCYSDLEPQDLADVVATTDGLGQPSLSGAGLCASLRAAYGAYGGRVASLAYDGVVIARQAPISLRAHAWLPISLEVAPSGVTLTHNGVRLFDGVPLAQWRPAAHWRLSLVALTNDVPGDAYWVDNLRVTSAGLLPHALASFEVSLNGHDFTRASHAFQYHSEPQPLQMSPPVGPLSGGTTVRVSGRHLGLGSNYTCRFGNATVPATFDASAAPGGDAISCVSPAAATGIPGALRRALNLSAADGADVPFAIALNGQNYVPVDDMRGSVFTYHSALRLSLVMPPTGPTDGGVQLTLVGRGLHGGSAYMCCVVAEAQPCTSGAANAQSLTAAVFIPPSSKNGSSAHAGTTPPLAAGYAPYSSVVDADDSIRCALPRTFNGGGAYQLRVSLNGQQFSYEPYQTLGFWSIEPIDALTTDTVEPAAGPSLGGSSVGIALNDVLFQPNLQNLDELFLAEGSGFPNRATLAFAPRCRFGDMLVAARLTSASRVECVAPSAEDAGAALDVRPATRADLLAAVTLYGGASALEADAATAAAVADGSYASSPSATDAPAAVAAATAATAAIRLTGAPGDDASGGAIFRRPKSGRSGGVDPARSRVTPTVPLHELRFSCDLSFASVGPRDGFSFSYGAGLSHMRGFGAGGGLRVAVLPGEHRLRAWLGGRPLADAPLPPSLVSAHVRREFALSVDRTRRVPGGGERLFRHPPRPPRRAVVARRRRRRHARALGAARAARLARRPRGVDWARGLGWRRPDPISRGISA